METLFFRQWRLFALAVGMIVVLGSSALLTIGRQEDPTITNLFATIITPFPGADPARVEALVTEKIEEELRQIQQISEIRSTSRTGISSVQIELSPFVPDQEIEQVWSEVRDALADAAVAFPPGVPEPEFDDDRTGAFTAISAIRPAPGLDGNPALLRRYADLLQDRLRALPGAKHVELFGAQDEEILVEIDQRRLASLGLTADSVARAIGQADAKVRAGRLRGATNDLLLEVAGEIDSLARVQAVPVATGPDGTTVRVGDVAAVRRSVREPGDSLAYADGTPAVLIAVRMDDDLQVDAWMSTVKGLLTEFEAELPGSIEHELLFDQSGYTFDRLGELATNMAIGVALVIGVLFLTLGWRSAAIVALILPLTSLSSIALLQAVGVPIHQMSVTGLIVALGLLVDAAIVMTDTVGRQLAAGRDRLAAVRHAVRRLAVPLLASTVTTILAFLPMVMLPGAPGDFVGSIAIAVVVMLLSSFVLALTITPALAGWLLRDGRHDGFWSGGLRGGALGRLFAGSLGLSLRAPGLAILAALVLPLMGFAAFPTLTAQFFPGVERDQFYVQLRLSDGAAITDTEVAALTAGRILAAEPGVSRVHWVIGESAPAFYYNMIADQDGVGSFAEALVTTASNETTARIIPLLQDKLDKALPRAQVIVRDLVQGPPVNAPLEMRIVGPDLEALRRVGAEARALMAGVPSVTHTTADLLGGAPKLVFDLDEDRVNLAGLDLGRVAQQLDALLEGATGGSLLDATEELPVRVRLGSAERGAAEAVGSLDLVPPNGAARAAAGAYPAIPLASLGQIRVVPAESAITRKDGERVNTIRGYLERGVLPEEALRQLQDRLAASSLALGPGMRIEFGGDADERAETVRNLTSTLGLVVALTIATIVLTFNSFRLSLVAGAVSLLSAGLSLLALAVFGYPFGIQALIGVIGSIGVSINAAIIIMTALQQDPGARAGDRARIRDVVLASSRHIISTTTTTFGGFLPLILAGGDFWPPFAMSIAGGVLLSTVISFYFTPPMFLLVMGRRKPAGQGALTPADASAGLLEDSATMQRPDKVAA